MRIKKHSGITEAAEIQEKFKMTDPSGMVSATRMLFCNISLLISKERQLLVYFMYKDIGEHLDLAADNSKDDLVWWEESQPMAGRLE